MVLPMCVVRRASTPHVLVIQPALDTSVMIPCFFLLTTKNLVYKSMHTK